MITRPMLAATIKEEHVEKLRFPLMCSPKLDGLRVLVHHEHGVVTRQFKQLPNHHVRKCLAQMECVGYDGELMLPDPGATFNDIQSAFMSRDGKPVFVYHVFDDFGYSSDVPWEGRFLRTHGVNVSKHNGIQPVPHVKVYSWDDVLREEEAALKRGYEGIMLRDPLGLYKTGRSTMREQGLMKLKRFKDSVGVVMGFVERQHNDNPMERDEFGLAKRSSHKENMVGAGTLGKLELDTVKWGTVHVGTGFTDLQRKLIWHAQSAHRGKIVEFKYQEVLKDKPRFPVFLRFRDDL